jgi:hypothetical protein
MRVFIAGASGALGSRGGHGGRRGRAEVIVHQLTALSGTMDICHVDRYFAVTNRLRTEGTDHLLAARWAYAASSPRATRAGRSRAPAVR